MNNMEFGAQPTQPAQTPQSGQNDHVFLANVIQIGLAELLRQDMMEFIEKNAARFREVVNDDPSLFERYQEDPKWTLKIIAERMRVH